MVGDKLRFRFRKTGPLRLVSHLDLNRCVERMLRRADIPFKSTAGFHPTPRLVFALSLPLGVAGLEEVVELELTEPRDADEILSRLTFQAPEGLTFTSVRVVEMKASAVPRRAVYRIDIEDADPVREIAAELMTAEKVWVDRLKPNPRRVNIRPYLRRLTVEDTTLELDLWVTTTGTARADELTKLLGVGDRYPSSVGRTLLEITDEVAADPSEPPPSGPAETAPLTHAPAAVAVAEPATVGTWGLSPNGPVVE